MTAREMIPAVGARVYLGAQTAELEDLWGVKP